MPRVVNVSNRLPVNIGQTYTKSSGGLVSALDGVRSEYDLIWIGWAGREISGADEQAEVRRRLREEFGCVPVFLSRQEADDHYLGFSNASLWPLLHYMQTYAEYEGDWFTAYQTVNERFAEAVLAEARDGDLVWVHDYHLMLLPSLLKRSNPRLKVGFFLHTPFPSYEVFRCHAQREALIDGVLGADLIGFHTFGYLRHFRSAVLRLLGLESEVNYISHEGSQSRIGVYPIGINWPGFREMLESEQYRDQRSAFEKQFAGKRLVLSVERMDYTKGIPRKLQAIERFLASHPNKRENTVFVIVAVPSRQGVERYQQLIDEVELAVGRINGQYSTVSNQPIHFLHHGVQFHELCGLYSRADVALVTPLMDGMNLVAKEFVACQGDDPGVLVLSEFAGAAQELFNALMVNPYDMEQMAEAIDKALAMSEDECRQMIEPMKQRVTTQDAVWWAKRFIADLAEVDSSVRSTTSAQTLENDLADRFAPSDERKALFLDYDGTLVDIVRDPAAAVPSEALHELLSTLAARDDLDLFVVSGRDHQFLGDCLGRHPITLIAEHGFRIREPGQSWQLFNKQIDLSWKQQVREIFQLYAATTPGSMVEEKTSAIVWHYRKADPEFGRWKAGELIGELMESISNLPVELHHGKKIVEVSSQQVNKGEALRYFAKRTDYAAILAAGDDQTDENMFLLRGDPELSRIISVKIGAGDTAAVYRLVSPARLHDFLAAVAETANQVQH